MQDFFIKEKSLSWTEFLCLKKLGEKREERKKPESPRWLLGKVRFFDIFIVEDGYRAIPLHAVQY